MAFPTIPQNRISTEARQVDVSKVLLALVRLVGTLLVAIPYVTGWSLGKAWLGLTMLWTAAVVGWREAGRPRAVEGSAEN